MRYPKHCTNRGTILFIVLVFILAVTTLVLISHLRIASEVDFVGEEMGKLRAYARCHSGAQVAVHRYLTAMRGRNEWLDRFRQPLEPRLFFDGGEATVNVLDLIDQSYYDAIPIEILEQIAGFEFRLSVKDSAGLINPLKIRPGMMARFLQSLGVEAGRTNTLIDSITDWMDPDDFPRQAGAEKEFYSARDLLFPPNRLFLSREELLLVRGMDGPLYNKLKDHVHFSVRNHGLNPNTMSRQLFRVFPRLGEETVDEILRQREQKPFETVADLTMRSRYNFQPFRRSLQFFTSDTLCVTISAPMGTGSEFYLRMEIGRPVRMGQRERDPFRGRRRDQQSIQRKDMLGETLFIQNWVEGTRQPDNE
jgi:type II secretory pathway component PulK